MTIETRLAEIRARVEAATPGPWTPMEYDHNPGDQGVPILGGGERGSMAAHLTAYTMTLSNVDQSEADAEFIAHARTDLPALLAAVEAFKEKCDYIVNEFEDPVYESNGYALGVAAATRTLMDIFTTALEVQG